MTLQDLIANRAINDRGCWIWKGGRTTGGYGRLPNPPKVGTQTVHRLAWMLANASEVPDGMEIMHLCNVRACFNPDHLKLGTHAENMAMARGPRPKFAGENNPRAKLTRAQAKKIIEDDHLSYEQLAADFGISARHVVKIKSRGSWREISCED